MAAVCLVSRQLLCILLVLRLASICSHGEALPVSSLQSSCQPLLFVFGESLADTGQYSAAMPFMSQADFPPYGEDYFSKPAGRWSNGRVFTDFISQKLGYGFLNPFLKAVNANFTYGANFATAGSTAMTDYDYIFPMSVQVEQFEEFLSQMLKSSWTQAQGYSQQKIAEAVLLVQTGENDYYHHFPDVVDKLALVGDVIGAMETALKRLYDLGGRNFLVMTVTPLGCTPAVRTDFASLAEDEYGCKVFINSIVELHNLHLEKLLTNLTAELPNAKWILFDAYSIFMDAYHNPANYGIEHPSKACCGAGGQFNYVKNVLCGMRADVNGTYVEATRCEDPSLYVIWDMIHPVESFAKYVAEGILTGKYLRPAFDITNSCRNLA